MAYFIKVTSLMKMRGDVSTNIRKKNGDKINMDETEIVKCYDSRKMEVKWLILNKNTKYQNKKEKTKCDSKHVWSRKCCQKVSPKSVGPGGLKYEYFQSFREWQFPSIEVSSM